MVQAIIELNDNANRILNIVKAQHNFKNKSEAVRYILDEYAEMSSQPELKPEFVERIKEAERGRFIKVDDFAARYLK
jgi:hypothetical protein